MRTNGKNYDRKTPVEEQTAIELIRQYEELFGQTSEGQVIQKIDYLPPAFEFEGHHVENCYTITRPTPSRKSHMLTGDRCS